MSEPPAGQVEPIPEEPGRAEIVDPDEGVESLLGFRRETFSGPPLAFILRHVNADHVTTLIQEDSAQNARLHSRWWGELWFRGVVIIAGIIGFLVLVNILKNDTDTLKDILKVFSGLIAGFLAGWGWASKKKPERDE